MWVRGNDNEWFLTSQHELAYLTLREAAANFLEYAAENQVILRRTPHPTGVWDWQPPAAVPVQVLKQRWRRTLSTLDRNHGLTKSEKPNYL